MLGEIIMVFTDHLLGQIHLHPGEIFNSAVAASAPEQLLELGAAYGIAPAQLFDGQGLIDMGLHIFQYRKAAKRSRISGSMLFVKPHIFMDTTVSPASGVQVAPSSSV